MGAMVNFLRWLGTFSIGYFGNDVSSWVGAKVPALQQKDSTGKPTGQLTWWGVMLILTAVTLVFLAFIWILNQLIPKRKKR